MDDLSRKQGDVDEEMGDDIDRISNLDETIRAKILSFLPIKDAIGTSALSTQWRNTWAVMSELAITEAYFSSSDKSQQTRSRLVNFVDRLFLLHKGPICKFKLSTKQSCHDALDRWVKNLSTYELTELTLELTSKRKHKLNSSFFSCKHLNSIYLCNCLVKMEKYEGFKVLSVLKLKNCSLTGAEIERFVCKCPLLKDLSLMNFREKSVLRIDAPNLERLVINGNFTDLQLFTPKLATACIDLEKNPNGEGCVPKLGCVTNFTRAFCGAPRIKMLGIRGYFLQYLAQGNFLEEDHVPTYFPHLKVLTLDVDLRNPEENRALSFLFSNAPILEDLDVIVRSSSQAKWGSLFNFMFCFEHLQTVSVDFEHLENVSMEDFLLNSLNLKFLMSVLGSSPLLRTLTISSEKICYNKEALVYSLYQFPKASTSVNIRHL